MTTSDDLDFGAGPDERGLAALLEQAQRVFEWRASIDSLTASAAHEGVSVVVASQGTLEQLDIDDEACAGGGAAVTDRLLRALAAAQANLATAIRASGASTFGPDSPQVRTIGRALEQRVGAAVALPPDPSVER
ncbi:MAG TPA: hypothetical protein PLX71_05790 [Phycicoccus sp.]|mgnify:CR=1 FL=1|nr:hypothetical protein [Phycicoccus sp.]